MSCRSADNEMSKGTSSRGPKRHPAVFLIEVSTGEEGQSVTGTQVSLSGLRRTLLVMMITWGLTTAVLAGLIVRLQTDVADLRMHPLAVLTSTVSPTAPPYVQFGKEGLIVARRVIEIPGPGGHTQGIAWNNLPGPLVNKDHAFEEGEVHFINNVFTIRTAGGAAARTGGKGISRDIGIAPDDTLKWRFATDGNLYTGADGRYDIGSPDGSRPRNIYLAGDLIVGGHVIEGNSHK